MVEHLKLRDMFRSRLVHVDDYECSYPRMELSDPHRTRAAAIALPRRGVCVKHVDGKVIHADPNHVIFFNRGEEFRIRHLACNCKDCGTEICVDPAVLQEIIHAHDERPPEDPDRPFAFTHGPVTPEISLAHRIVLRRAKRGEWLEVEEAAFNLLGLIIETSGRAYQRPPVSRRPDTVEAHADLADRVKIWLAHHYREPLLLHEMAAGVASSPYHLCRVFHEQTGITLSRYVHRLRFNEAVDRLADGEEDLTSLALDLGFSSHSHFTSAFRREYGQTPSAVRQRLSA